MANTKTTVLLDLDGTLSDPTHRLKFIKTDQPDWEAFNKACLKDKPNKWCVFLVNALLKCGFRIIVLSARPAEYYEGTIKWLEKAGVKTDCRALTAVLLRKDNHDRTRSAELKEMWLKDNGLFSKVLLAVDDSQAVVDMYGKYDIPCLKVSDSWEDFIKNNGWDDDEQ